LAAAPTTQNCLSSGYTALIETWKFTKNELLKLLNSVNADFILTGLNLNRTIQKKSSTKNRILWMITGHYNLNVETWLLFASPNQNFWLRACF